MNHLSATISNPNRNCPLDDSIYIHLAAKRPRRSLSGCAARGQLYGVSYRSWILILRVAAIVNTTKKHALDRWKAVRRVSREYRSIRHPIQFAERGPAAIKSHLAPQRRWFYLDEDIPDFYADRIVKRGKFESSRRIGLNDNYYK